MKNITKNIFRLIKEFFIALIVFTILSVIFPFTFLYNNFLDMMVFAAIFLTAYIIISFCILIVVCVYHILKTQEHYKTPTKLNWTLVYTMEIAGFMSIMFADYFCKNVTIPGFIPMLIVCFSYFIYDIVSLSIQFKIKDLKEKTAV